MSAEAVEQLPQMRIAVLSVESQYTCRSDHPKSEGWVYHGSKAHVTWLADRFNGDGNEAFGPWYVRHEMRFISEWRTVEP